MNYLVEDYPHFEGEADGGCPACGFIFALLITLAVVGVILGYLHK